MQHLSTHFLLLNYKGAMLIVTTKHALCTNNQMKWYTSTNNQGTVRDQLTKIIWQTVDIYKAAV